MVVPIGIGLLLFLLSLLLHACVFGVCFFWGVGVCVVGVLLFLSTSDGQLTDYYLVNHCSYSSEGATVGI